GERQPIAGITDLREPVPSPEIERAWCRRYAASDVVIGAHGSNMLLPSGHAGAAIELIPDERLGNMAQSFLPRGDDPRDVLFRHRFIPPSSSTRYVATVVESLITEKSGAVVNFGQRWTDHAKLTEDPFAVRKTRSGA